MAVLNRKTLKNFFRHGSRPSEIHFSDLIDSSINKIDDGFAKDASNGLQLSPQGTSVRLMSFFGNLRDNKPVWDLSINPEKGANGLSFNEVSSGVSSLFLREGGNVGIGTYQPSAKLEVAGMLAMEGRKGSFACGRVPADGSWHPVLQNLEGVVAYEIMAFVAGKKGRGKYALAHILALSTYGNSRNVVKCTQAYYGWFINKISARWVGKVKDYSLELRTRSHYGLNEEGDPFEIEYQVTKLWEESGL